MIMRKITLEHIIERSRARADKWHGGDMVSDTGWNLADWSNAMEGESGELMEVMAQVIEFAMAGIQLGAHGGAAANLVKKLRRKDESLSGAADPEVHELKIMLGEELADVLLYLVLVAEKAGIDLPEAVIAKYNAVSEREGFPHRLAYDIEVFDGPMDHLAIHRVDL